MNGEPPPTPPAKTARLGRWLRLLISGLRIAGAIAGLIYLATPTCVYPRTHSNENSAVGALKALMYAQANWRASDLDLNGVPDCWTKDVAGMYAFEAHPGRRVACVSFDLAAADPAGVPHYPGCFPKGCVPHKGYFFRLIPSPKSPDVDPKDQFAYCAYPAEHGETGFNTFILSEYGAMWRADLGPGARGIDKFPENPPAANPPWIPYD